MKFVGFFSEVCWISQLSLLDFSVKFVGFLSELCWISQRFFLDFSVKFVGFHTIHRLIDYPCVRSNLMMMMHCDDVGLQL